MANPFDPVDVKPATLTEVVYDRIRDAIVTRALEPGARITEAAIAQQLNVSKTPVREALLRLREIGLVEPEGARGNRVATPGTQELRDAYEYRRALETFAARMAAERADAQIIKEMRTAARQSRQHARKGDLAAFREPDRVLHEAIARAAGNERVARGIQDVSFLIRTVRERDQPGAKALAPFGDAHMRIVDAIEARDGVAAAEAMWDHLVDVEAHFLADL